MNNFTPRAQQTLALARKEADRLNHEAVGSGHLFLGILRLHKGTAFDVLASMIAVGLEPLQTEIETRMGLGSATTAFRSIPYDAAVKSLLAQAGKQAKLLNHSYVGTEHILLASLIEVGIVKDVLESFGVTFEQTRTNVLKELDPNLSPESTATSDITPTPMPILRDITSDAIRYWEKRRVVYNIVLAGIVLIVFFLGLPLSWGAISIENTLGLFVLAVAANVVFCSVYLPDFVAQMSDYRVVWRRHRWMLFVVGLILAGIITRWIAVGLFAIHPSQ